MNQNDLIRKYSVQNCAGDNYYETISKQVKVAVSVIATLFAYHTIFFAFGTLSLYVICRRSSATSQSWHTDYYKDHNVAVEMDILTVETSLLTVMCQALVLYIPL